MKGQMVYGFRRILALVILASVLGTPAASRAQDQEQPSATAGQPQRQGAQRQPESGGFGRQLARETREAAGEEDTGQFKKSPSVVWLAKVTGLSLEHAYWLAFGLNFLVVAVVIGWAGWKYLPGLFRDRTAAIQKAMQEARKASEDAQQRLRDVETRLAKLGDEVAAMNTASEQDLAAEEARIKSAADADARKIIESAEQEIAAAAKAARRDLTAYAADLAVSLAKRQIHVDAGTDQALVRGFAERLGDAGKGKN
jgi:F-type H+-transporting ATPase subunit b